jgi:hypothetical protein
MSIERHGLLVSPAGSYTAYDPASKEEGDGCYGVDKDAVMAFLPHSCDEWVVGHGDASDVVAALQQLRDEVDAAITYVEQLGEST